MSGARIPGGSASPAPARSSRPAWGSAFCEPSTVLPRLALKPRPAAIANNARKASAATIQGKAFVFDSRAGTLPPTAVPHRWQNFAPALSSAAQEAQVAPASGAPQFAQYLPVAGAPQDGHALDCVETIRSNYSPDGGIALKINDHLRLPAGGFGRSGWGLRAKLDFVSQQPAAASRQADSPQLVVVRCSLNREEHLPVFG